MSNKLVIICDGCSWTFNPEDAGAEPVDPPFETDNEWWRCPRCDVALEVEG